MNLKNNKRISTNIQKLAKCTGTRSYWATAEIKVYTLILYIYNSPDSNCSLSTLLFISCVQAPRVVAIDDSAVSPPRMLLVHKLDSFSLADTARDHKIL